MNISPWDVLCEVAHKIVVRLRKGLASVLLGSSDAEIEQDYYDFVTHDKRKAK